MSSKEKVKQTVRSEVVQNKSSNNKNSNSSKVYTVKETTVEKRIKRTYKNNEYDYTKDNLKQGLDTVNISKNKIPVSTANSKNSYQNKKIEVYEYSTQNISKNYTQDQNQEIYEKKEKIEKVEPSSSNKYIIETKKIETFKPRYPESSISLKKNNEIKQLMRNIWNNENRFSNAESLYCLSYNNRSEDYSQNRTLIEEYEEEIRELRNILIQKDQEIKNLMYDLNQKESNLKMKNQKKYNYPKNFDNFESDSHELQVISTKLSWNEINVPSPINDIFIESFKYEYPQRMQFTTAMEILGRENENDNYSKWNKKIIRKEEEDRDTLSERDAVLEIQELGSLTILSRKNITNNNICQHLGSIIILSKTKDERTSEFSENIKEEKYAASSGLEVIPVEKEPLVFQKIEEINITSLTPKRENEIQELNGLEIINYKRNKDKLRNGKEVLEAQSLNELEIPREYDMLLVKPSWNSLKIQGSGLNLLAVPKKIELENQEVDELEILGTRNLDKIQVLIPLPDNNIQKLDNFQTDQHAHVERSGRDRLRLSARAGSGNEVPLHREDAWRRQGRRVRDRHADLQLHQRNVRHDALPRTVEDGRNGREELRRLGKAVRTGRERVEPESVRRRLPRKGAFFAVRQRTGNEAVFPLLLRHRAGFRVEDQASVHDRRKTDPARPEAVCRHASLRPGTEPAHGADADKQGRSVRGQHAEGHDRRAASRNRPRAHRREGRKPYAGERLRRRSEAHL